MFGEPIYSYGDDQAEEDGVLVALQAGERPAPYRVSRGAWEELKEYYKEREFRVLSGAGRGSQVRLIGRFAPATPRFYRFPAGMDSSPSAQVQLLP